MTQRRFFLFNRTRLPIRTGQVTNYLLPFIYNNVNRTHFKFSNDIV